MLVTYSSVRKDTDWGDALILHSYVFLSLCFWMHPLVKWKLSIKAGWPGLDPLLTLCRWRNVRQRLQTRRLIHNCRDCSSGLCTRSHYWVALRYTNRLWKHIYLPIVEKQTHSVVKILSKDFCVLFHAICCNHPEHFEINLLTTFRTF